MELKSKSVKLFCAVVESGSLLAAANKIALSAPAASRVIAQLESRLGFALFSRTGKALVLTDQGAEFYRVATESLRVWRTLEDFSSVQKHKKRTLRTAVLARHCSDVIIPAVVQVLKAHEHSLQVTMDVHSSRDFYYSKYSHPFDVGFGTLLTVHDDLIKVPIAFLPFRLVVSKDNPLACKPCVGPADYAHEDFIVLSHGTPEREYSDCLLPAQSRQQCVAEVSSTQVALRFVKRGVGVHFTDKLAGMSVSSDCVALEIQDPLTIPFYVFWSKTETELSLEIRQCIGQIAASIQAVGIELTAQGQAFLRDALAQKPCS